MTKTEKIIKVIMFILGIISGFMLPKACKIINKARSEIKQRGLKGVITKIWEGKDANNK